MVFICLGGVPVTCTHQSCSCPFLRGRSGYSSLVWAGWWGAELSRPGAGVPELEGEVQLWAQEHHLSLGVILASSGSQAADRELNHFLRASRLPAPAGFDIKAAPWLTGALSLAVPWRHGRVYSNPPLLCWFTVPVGQLLIHFPSPFAHRVPQKPSFSNIFGLWFPQEPRKKNTVVVHLLDLTCWGLFSQEGTERKSVRAPKPSGAPIILSGYHQELNEVLLK